MLTPTRGHDPFAGFYFIPWLGFGLRFLHGGRSDTCNFMPKSYSNMQHGSPSPLDFLSLLILWHLKFKGAHMHTFIYLYVYIIYLWEVERIKLVFAFLGILLYL